MNKPNDIFDISPDWGYTAVRASDGITFSFASKNACPGFILEISNWRLRRVTESSSKRPERVEGLQSAIDEEQQKARHNVKTVGPTISLGRKAQPSAIDDPPLNQAMFFIVVPLSRLLVRNKSSYAIDNTPWPDSSPPRVLQHVEPGGFDTGLNVGIVAAPITGDGVWIVRKFSKCQVELSSNELVAFLKEAPIFHQISVSIKEANSKLDHLRMAAMQPPTKNIYTTHDEWRTIDRNGILFHRFPRPNTCARRVLRLLDKAPSEGLPFDDVCTETRLNPNRPQDAFPGKLRDLFGDGRIIQVYDHDVSKRDQPLKYIKMTDPH